MITLHALKYSRATRALWLLDDLGQTCNRIDYERTETFRAPESLSGVHPLGKSPVIKDGDRVIGESATILRYLVEKYGDASHQPERGTTAFWRHEALLDYVEASFGEVVLGAILPAFAGKDVTESARAALEHHLSYIAGELSTGPYLCGDKPMLADIQMSYLLALLERFGFLKETPRIAAYWQRLQEQPGYIAAVAAAGPMAPPG
ncbi:glutathione S-transferase [Labrenzia sp. 011]|uniref:glutathione S-transferase family protein n=1 Tax=Labrenzia sp. 011 TaxID=2171494 RepID=UPI000D51ADBD|nr:glutathione S-transferase [Labrenzia sp. 011]PVB61398.1 glutathione S-transferase [Labrenzia sp. 011]